MKFSTDLIDELSLLSQFSLSSTLEGLKIHADASNKVIGAAKRLFDKGLVTQADGGYLTELGKDAAQHLLSLNSILTTPVNLDTAS
ncbi:MAG: TIGR02647 family protein [Pseudomonadales bacterium]|nr:TIGR02647 family protein [Pseudomonadales bacterium]NRA19949.1 TIGR02647 family protein [Oceanospirillaceae bacterium]